MADGARVRREAVRQLADLRRRLAAAEETLADALAAMKSAEGAFDAASDRFDAAERALDAAREERAQARRDRYAARQTHERASTTADRLARRVRDLSERLDRMGELTGAHTTAGRAWRAHGRPGWCHSGLVPEKIPISDFYVTCATVIPVLFLAVAVQGGAWGSLIRASSESFGVATPLRWLLGLAAPVYILSAGGVGEAVALVALYRGSEFPIQRGIVFAATLILVVSVVAGPFLVLMQRVMLPEIPQLSELPQRSDGPDPEGGEPPQGTSDDGGQPGASEPG